MKIAKLFSALLTLAIALTLLMPVTAEAAGKTITAGTQAKLEKALADPDVTKIAIKAKKGKTLTIPEGDYGHISLVVDGSSINLNNFGTFRVVKIRDAKLYAEFAAGNTIQVTDKALTAIIMDQAEVSELQLNCKDATVALTVNGGLERLNVKKTAALTVTGTTRETITISSASGAKGTKVKTEISMKAENKDYVKVSKLKNTEAPSKSEDWYQSAMGDWMYPDAVNCWKKIDGKWYCFDANGYCYRNSVTPDGYYVGADCALIKSVARKDMTATLPAGVDWQWASVDTKKLEAIEKKYDYLLLETYYFTGASDPLQFSDYLYLISKHYYDKNGKAWTYEKASYGPWNGGASGIPAYFSYRLIRIPVTLGNYGKPEELYEWEKYPYIAEEGHEHYSSQFDCVFMEQRNGVMDITVRKKFSQDSAEFYADENVLYYTCDTDTGKVTLSEEQIRKKPWESSNPIISGEYDYRDQLFYDVTLDKDTSEKTLTLEIEVTAPTGEIVNSLQIPVDAQEFHDDDYEAYINSAQLTTSKDYATISVSFGPRAYYMTLIYDKKTGDKLYERFYQVQRDSSFQYHTTILREWKAD